MLLFRYAVDFALYMGGIRAGYSATMTLLLHQGVESACRILLFAVIHGIKPWLVGVSVRRNVRKALKCGARRGVRIDTINT